MALPSPPPPGVLANNIPTLSAEDTRIVLEGLSPNTNYSITLCAFTDIGCGNTTNSINQTNEDGEI